MTTCPLSRPRHATLRRTRCHYTTILTQATQDAACGTSKAFPTSRRDSQNQMECSEGQGGEEGRLEYDKGECLKTGRKRKPSSGDTQEYT